MRCDDIYDDDDRLDGSVSPAGIPVRASKALSVSMIL